MYVEWHRKGSLYNHCICNDAQNDHEIKLKKFLEAWKGEKFTNNENKCIFSIEIPVIYGKKWREKAWSPLALTITELQTTISLFN